MNWNQRYTAAKTNGVEPDRGNYHTPTTTNGGVPAYNRDSDPRRLLQECKRCCVKIAAEKQTYKHPVFGKICQDCRQVLKEK